MTKSRIKEVPIFPIACERGHNFTPFRDDSERVMGFYKGGDRNTLYATLYCQKCGETKEVVMKQYPK